jgi:predicted P-loop ATPase
MTHSLKAISVGAVLLAISINVYAGDHKGEHPGKKVKPESAIQSINRYIENDSSLKGGFLVNDRLTKRIRNLKLMKVHKVREVDGQYYTCADFIDTNKDKVDLDFYLKDDGKGHEKWTLSKIMVHKINGKETYKPPVFN